MGQRLQLHDIFLEMTENVYFQPPANIQMQYPCIVYKRDDIRTQYADDSPYLSTKRYLVTVIDRDPDSDIPDKVRELPLTGYRRFFIKDNLNHDVFAVHF